MMFLMIFLTFAILIMYVIPSLTKKINADIIQINDIEMKVVSRYRHDDCSHSKDRGRRRNDFELRLRGVKDSSRRARLTGMNNYVRYHMGDVVIMQEVIYKKDDEIFADIIFANTSHYKKLSKYKIEHPEGCVDDIRLSDNLEEDLESKLDDYYESKNAMFDSFEIIKLILLIVGIIHLCQN